MGNIKIVSNGFFICGLGYVVIILVVSLILLLLNIHASYKLHFLSLELGEMYNNSSEMSSLFTFSGIVFFGLLGAFVFFLFSKISSSLLKSI
ncbi:hypothetical protein CEQ21_10405 [Niallia circulans]|uniref:Uncharacterized protein n=1 Tax=Niallia circulans TaxID=1397 RepID=A0A553SG87_NIACI|nr:hypothetical protein [Niallia circulans]TRZ36005.1 hypothetical protein CEQ21_10405 [Niallia circulans]